MLLPGRLQRNFGRNLCAMEQSQSHSQKRLLKAAGDGSIEEVIRCIGEGADVTFQEEGKGESPLMAAAKGGHSEVVKKLLEEGAPWNALDRQGLCAGDYAMDAGHQPVVDILIDAGVSAELILGAAARSLLTSSSGNGGSKAGNLQYLQQRVEFSETRLVDEEQQGVMMAWERPLMEAHAHAICQQGGDILNVGFGMGLVDYAIQRRSPASHTIVEAHPDVYQRMLAQGWADKPGVRLVFGRWQDVLPQLATYDGIFFDTYGEYYDDLHQFHEALPKLMKPDGIYSFFNGLCGDNAFFHVVYCQVVALQLAHLGFQSQFTPLPVRKCFDATTWEGLQQMYWQLDTYFLPFVTFKEPEEKEEPDQGTPAT
eukprot:jgi/Mesen1/10023/ME000073S09303